MAVLLTVAGLIWLKSRKVRIDHTNVTADWGTSLTDGLGVDRGPIPAPDVLVDEPGSPIRSAPRSDPP